MTPRHLFNRMYMFGYGFLIMRNPTADRCETALQNHDETELNSSRGYLDSLSRLRKYMLRTLLTVNLWVLRCNCDPDTERVQLQSVRGLLQP